MAGHRLGRILAFLLDDLELGLDGCGGRVFELLGVRCKHLDFSLDSFILYFVATTSLLVEGGLLLPLPNVNPNRLCVYYLVLLPRRELANLRANLDWELLLLLLLIRPLLVVKLVDRRVGNEEIVNVIVIDNIRHLLRLLLLLPRWHQ